MRMPGMIRPQGVAMPPPGFPGMFPPGFVGGKTCLFIVSPVLTNAMAAYVIIKIETTISQSSLRVITFKRMHCWKNTV